MLGKIPASRLRLIERVVDRAGALLTRGQTARRGGNWAAAASTLKPLLPKFIRHYYRGVAEDDLAARDVDDLAGAALWHLSAGLTRRPGTPWVHVCNPDAANEGYGSPHTVVAVVCDDMPFLVDSISMVLNQAGLSLQYIAHPILSVLRDRRGRLTDILEEPGEHGQLESWQFYEIDREADPAVIASLQLRLLATLGDVRAAVADWSEMRRRAREVAAHLEVAAHGKSGDVIEARDMLEWMDDNHFTFLGYRRYKLKRGRRSDKLEPAADSGLGILRIADAGVAPRPTIIEGTLREQARERDQMVITKANSLSTVHRAEYLDYVGIKIFDAKGEVAGEHRFLGLWTSSAYSLNPRDIPVLRNKLAKVIAHFGLSPTSHDGKALIHVLENFPRDELFQASVAELIRLARGVVNLYERQQVRLFLRRDAFHRFYSCLVYVPRDRYNTTVRQRLEGVLRDSLHGSAVDSQVQLSNSALARVHLLVRTSAQDDHRGEPRVDTGAIEARLAAATRTWADELEAALAAGHDEAATRQLVGRYVEAVPVAYHADTTPRAAVADIAELEALRAAVQTQIIDPVVPASLRSANFRSLINPTGRFVTGGPKGDAGLTGRKIIVDTYGGSAPHGGGAFSGKDPSKVDRSAAYMARFLAKQVVARGWARRALVQLAYAIGVAEPVSFFVETYGTETDPRQDIAADLVREFDLRPQGIIDTLDLQRPLYYPTAAYGHFGREDLNLPWEAVQ